MWVSENYYVVYGFVILTENFMLVFVVCFRYLIETCANIAAVNNDGDLPFDICEDDDMEKLLQDEMDKQGEIK
jgi:hypothetical protein